MQNNKVSLNQIIFSIVLFNFGSSVVIGINTAVGQDSWLAIIFGAVMSVPLFLMYARIITIFPQKSLYEIAETLFGKIGGKIISGLFIWYAIHLAAMILRNFSEFVEISAMPETPQLPIMILMILTTIYIARSDIRAIGKWSVISILFVGVVVILTFLPSISSISLEGLLPIAEHSPSEIAEATFQTFAFPYAETVIFLCIGIQFKKENKPYRVLFHALIITLIIFLLVFFRNLALLGRAMMEDSIFPSYVMARVIEVGGFLARIEGSISSNFLFAGIVKISICLLAAAKGLSSMFNLSDHKPMVVPVGMLMLMLCAILYKNTMEMVAFFDYYPYYAFPFQVIIPLIILVAGEIHNRKQKNKELQQPDADVCQSVESSP